MKLFQRPFLLAVAGALAALTLAGGAAAKLERSMPWTDWVDVRRSSQLPRGLHREQRTATRI